MKRTIYLFCAAVLLCSCQKTTIGYLITEYAGYDPDYMEVRKELDDDPGDPNPLYEMYLSWGYTPAQIAAWYGTPERINTGADYYNVKYDLPHLSTPIEGIQGTPPIFVSIDNVKASGGGDASKMTAELSVRGDGTIIVPLYNDIPMGTYLISLRFKNEGYSKVVEDCFTIIVK